MAESIVLYVHSSITIYLAKSLLQHQFPDAVNVVILYDRVSEKELEVLEGTKINFIQTFGDRFVTPRSFPGINLRVQNFIKNKIGQEFILVVPHLYYDTLQIFAQSPLCKKIIYSEEGDISYLSQGELDTTYRDSGQLVHKKLVRKLFSLGNLYERHPFPVLDKPFESAAFHETGFPFLKGEKKVFPFREAFTNKSYQFHNNYNHATILLINKVDLKVWKDSPEIYTKGLGTVLDYIKANFGPRLFLKPHPALSAKKEKMQELLALVNSHGLQAALVEDPIELVLVNSADVKLVTSTSSLVRYAIFAGNKPYFWWNAHVKPGSPYAGILEQFRDQINFI